MKAENQINDLEYKKAKNNQSEQQEGKRIEKKQGQCKQPPEQFQEVQQSHHRAARRRERARNWKCI